MDMSTANYANVNYRLNTNGNINTQTQVDWLIEFYKFQ